MCNDFTGVFGVQIQVTVDQTTNFMANCFCCILSHTHTSTNLQFMCAAQVYSLSSTVGFLFISFGS